MATEADREPMVRKKIAHLDSLRVDIERKQAFTPKLFWLALVAIPIAFIKGIGWAMISILFVGALVLTVAYLLGVRQRDYAAEAEQLGRLYPKRPPAPAAPEPAASGEPAAPSEPAA